MSMFPHLTKTVQILQSEAISNLYFGAKILDKIVIFRVEFLAFLLYILSLFYRYKAFCKHA